MKTQQNIYKQYPFSDERQVMIRNPHFQRLVSQVTTVKFQVITIVVMAVIDYLLILTMGIKEKLCEYLVLYAIEACFFLAYIHLILPKMAQSRHSIFTIISIICFSLTLFLLFYLITYSVFTDNPTSFIFKATLVQIFGSLYRGWHKIILAFLLWGAYVIKNSARREQVLESNILYSRISPHLLFNALSMLPVGESTPLKNERIIELLSKYTHNAMADLGPDGKGLFTTELNQLETLIQINELRYGTMYIQFIKNLPRDISEYRIPPQIIVTLAENVFKYGILNDPAKPVSIAIAEENRYLSISITNFKHAYNNDQHSSKIGIASASKRLSNIYGKNHHFTISENAEVFNVEMGFPI